MNSRICTPGHEQARGALSRGDGERLSIQRWLHAGKGVDTETVTFTIGYAGKSLPDFVSALREAGVNRVVDVRAVALSRKKGFSKSALGEALSRERIEYMHLPIAGNPYRDQKGDIAACLARYSEYVDQHPEIIDAVVGAVAGRRAALLCFEADPAECHRSVIASGLTAREPLRRVKHL